MRITVNTEEMDFPCMWLDSTRLYTSQDARQPMGAPTQRGSMTGVRFELFAST